MNVYMYKYNCKRWYGDVTGLRNFHTHRDNNGKQHTDEDILKLVTEDAKKLSGSRTCDVDLLEKFYVTIKTEKNYAAITSIPFTVDNNGTVNKE